MRLNIMVKIRRMRILDNRQIASDCFVRFVVKINRV